MLTGTNDGAALVAGTEADWTTYGYGSSFQPQYVSPTGQWGIVSYSPVYFHQDHYVNGNVGIGTTSPNKKLHIDDVNYDNHFRMT